MPMVNSKKEALKKEEVKVNTEKELEMFNQLMVRNTADEMKKLINQNKGKKKGRRNKSGNNSSNFDNSDHEEEIDSVNDHSLNKVSSNMSP